MGSIFCLFAAVLVFASLCSLAAAAEFLPVMSSDTLDYYAGYGEPELSASLRGNQEFGKGESAAVQIALANNGLIQKVSYREYVISEDITYTDGNMKNPTYNISVPSGDPKYDDREYLPRQVILTEDLFAYLGSSANTNAQNALAMTEMRLENNRINAQSLNVKFECDSPFIEVETGKDYVFLSSLSSGNSNSVSVPIRISPKTPAGEYLINVTVDYQYPSNVKMIKAGNGTDGFTAFLYSDSYIAEYTSKQTVLQIPIYVKSGAVFEVTELNGTLDSGRTKNVSVTYTNVGDKTAYDAECKVDLMYPLSTSRNKRSLGDVAPGESVTIDYQVASHSSALPKVYGMNTDVRFYDENDNLQISPGIKLNLELIQSFRIFTLKNAMISVLILIVVSLLIDYRTSQKKKTDPDYSLRNALQSKVKRK